MDSSFRDTGRFSKFLWIPEVAHMLSLYLQGVEIELIFAVRAAVSEIQANFQICRIGHKLGKWPKFQKLHIHSLSTPGSRNWAYFCSTGSGFHDTGQFSKLPCLPYLASGQSSRSCIYAFYPGSRNWDYFHFKGVGFWDTGRFAKLPYLGIKLGKWPKFHKLHIHYLSTPGG